MITAEGERLFHGFVHDSFQARFIGVAELFVESADDLLGALDQVVVAENQAAGRRMRVEVL